LFLFVLLLFEYFIYLLLLNFLVHFLIVKLMDIYWDCNLFYRCWVMFIWFGLHGDGCRIVYCSGFMQRVGMPCQFNGLGNGAEGCLHASGLDLSSLPKSSFPCPSSKSLKDHESFTSIHILKVWIDTTWNEVKPVPLFQCHGKYILPPRGESKMQ